jgi:uncharacterized protein (DUF488 family)
VEDNIIYTSYFANLKKLPDNVCPISICAKAPSWYTGIQYKALAPKYGFFMKYKETHDEAYYIEHFNSEVLDKLRPNDVVATLRSLAGDKIPCMMCFEKPGDFCHRHLVADWLNNSGLVSVSEYNTKQDNEHE